MTRANLTLALEEELLQEARLIAAQLQTSVNELVRQYLQQLVGQQSRRQAAWASIQGLLEKPSVHFGGPLPKRDELHER